MRLLIVGAGGHAKVVLDAAILAGFEIAGVVGRPDGATRLLDVPVTHELDDSPSDGFIVAIGDNRRRAEEYDRLLSSGLTPVSVVHPSAVISQFATVEPGAFIAAGVIVNAGSTIGENSILNTGCTVDHDCTVGAHTLVGPGANLCGGVGVGPGSLVGTGAAVLPTISIGAWSVIGAGAAVVERVGDSMVATGVPAIARPIASAATR